MLKSCVVALAVLSLPAFATAPVIYGDDNRQEVFEATPMNQKLAHSAATMIEKAKLSRSEDRPGLVQVNQTTLRSWLEAQFEEEGPSSQKVSFCEGERFTEQPNAGMCSGFLVGPDLLVTAGHCLEVPDFCGSFDWVFDFKVDAETKTAGVDLKEENIYSCKKIISSALATGMGLDYALVQLDRPVSNREPLNLRTSGMVSVGSPLVVIGSPSGLPLKVSAGANVRANTHAYYFASNLDTFQGNSGSAVINAETGVVEGILVRGEDDFEANVEKMCIAAKRCEDTECRGEDVSRMTSIPEYAVKDALFKSAEKGDVKELDKLLRTKFWIDIYGKDGRTALMVSLENNRQAFASRLLEKGADVKIADAGKNTALHSLARSLNRKNTNLLNTLVKAGADLESKNKSGETALLAAARVLNAEAVRILIAAGADRNALNSLNENVLFAFARKGDQRVVKELIQLGVDASVRNSEGQTITELKRAGALGKLGK